MIKYTVSRLNSDLKLIIGRLSKLQKKILVLLPERRKVVVEYITRIEKHPKSSIYKSIRLLIKYGLIHIKLEKDFARSFTGHFIYIKRLHLTQLGIDFLYNPDNAKEVKDIKNKINKIELDAIYKEVRENDKIIKKKREITRKKKNRLFIFLIICLGKYTVLWLE